MKFKFRKTGNKKIDTAKMALRILGLIVIIIVALFAVVYGAGKIMMAIGGNRLYKNATSNEMTIADAIAEDGEEEEIDEETAKVWQEGWVKYDGKIYQYNEDILTFLILGIDKDGKVKEAKNATDGGQSDLMLLAVANPDTKKISMIAVNRDTMVDVKMIGMGADGEDIVYPAQLTVQHGFGDGLEQSCELTEEAISKLFYDLPIHGYLSFNYGGLAIVNKAIGGVDVVVPGDYTKIDKKWVEGAEITLKSEKDVFNFVRERDVNEFESARDRLFRQKTFLVSMAKKTLSMTKEDITLPVSLYTKAKDYTLTDITIDEMSYLAGMLSGYSFDSEDIYTLEGETIMGEKFEEFYPDKDALKRLIFDVFYEEVELEE